MTAAPPKLILFDLGNVLLHFDHEIACRQIAELTELSAADVRRIVFEEGLEARYERGELTTSQFHQAFCQAAGKQPVMEAFARAHSDIFTLNAEIIPIVAQLKAAGHRLGILSNTCDAHWQLVADGRYGILPRFFDVLALSHQLGAMKPDREVYERTAELAGVKPQEIFFFDDIPENVASALACGFDAVIYTGAGPLAQELRKRQVEFNY